MSAILAKVYRGSLVESIHRGDWVITDGEGKIVYSQGDPAKVTYWRSAAKPFQAIPVVESGAAEKYQISQDELALMCASHSGESYHVARARSILKKIGLSESALRCGTHLPAYQPAAKELLAAGKEPSQIHNNCSGKHGGMLALCKFYGWDISSYLEIEHPLQQRYIDTVSDFTGVARDQIILGIDGCGVPVYGLPLQAMAKAWALLANPNLLSDKRQQAAIAICEAMRAYPEMVGGTGRFSSEVMRGFSHIDLVAKSGAEALFGFALPKQGLGFTIKIEDGLSRAIPVIVLEILAKLGFDSRDIPELQKYYPLQVKNHHQDVVGRIEAEVVV